MAVFCMFSLGIFALASTTAPRGVVAAEAAASASGGYDSPGMLAHQGKPCATIVLPAQASAGEEYAANDLQTVLEKVCGVALPIAKDNQPIQGNRVLIGNTCFTDAVVAADERKALGKEGYIVRLRGRDLALAGGGPYGTIYAADELFDRLGCRWYLPGKLGEVTPRVETIRFDRIDVRRTPSFAMRWVGKGPRGISATARTASATNVCRPPSSSTRASTTPSRQYVPHREYDTTHPEFFALHGGHDRPRRVQAVQFQPAAAGEIARHMAATLRENAGHRPDLAVAHRRADVVPVR